jgi:tetratricopeptide (TPR) repeat protein
MRNQPASSKDHALSQQPVINPQFLLLLLAVACVTLIVHWPALSARAVMFDDQQYLDDNARVQSPGWRSAWAFLSEVLHPSTVGGYYQPLAMISLMLDYAIGGRPDNLAPFHATSLALHVINTALVTVLLQGLFGRPLVSAVLGLIFGVHPMNVESIPWLAERKTLLGAFFALAALNCYVAYATVAGRGPGAMGRAENAVRPDPPRPGTGREKRGQGYLVACLVFFVLALLSKPTTTPLPICMLLLDVWPLRRIGRRAVLEKIPFFVLAAASAVITVVSQRNTAEITRPAEYPALAIPLILCHNIVFYLRKLVWPADLSGFYDFPGAFSLSNPAYLAGVVGTVALLTILLVSLRWTRAFLVGWLFFFFAILPTMGIIGFTAVIAADRFVYLPMVGLLVSIAFAASLCGFEAHHRTASIAALFVGLAAAGACALATRGYLSLWQDSESYTRHMLKYAPDAPSLRVALGHLFLQRSQFAEAADEFRQAARRDPAFAEARMHLGYALFKLGRVDEAMVELNAALSIRKNLAGAHNYLADCLAALGRNDEAAAHYESAVSLRPGDYKPYYNLATFLARIGRGEPAVAHFERALRIKPDNPAALYNLGLTLFQMGRIDEAMARFNGALRFRPDMVKAHYQLGRAHLKKSDTASALAAWREALRLQPDFVEAMGDLAWVLASCDDPRLRNGNEALAWATRACERTNQQEPVLLDALAAAQSEAGRSSDAAATQRQAIEAAGRSPDKLTLGSRTVTVESMRSRLERYAAGK